MKMYLISDKMDTLVGFRLTGVLGSVVRHDDELDKCIDEALKDKELGILLITDVIEQRYGTIIRKRLKDMNLPLLVTIPKE